jgi:hypothetical protein
MWPKGTRWPGLYPAAVLRLASARLMPRTTPPTIYRCAGSWQAKWQHSGATGRPVAASPRGPARAPRDHPAPAVSTPSSALGGGCVSGVAVLGVGPRDHGHGCAPALCSVADGPGVALVATVAERCRRRSPRGPRAANSAGERRRAARGGTGGRPWELRQVQAHGCCHGPLRQGPALRRARRTVPRRRTTEPRRRNRLRAGRTGIGPRRARIIRGSL